MPSPDLDADDPYAVLGVSADAPMHEIEERAQELLGRYDDGDAIETISEAYEEIEDQPRRERINGTLQIPLLPSVEPETVTAGEEVTLSVEDDQGTPIEGAGIKIQENRKGQTGPDGTDSVRLTDPGTVEFTVEKHHPDSDATYSPGTAKVTVERRQMSLRFDRVPSSATVGDEVTVRVTDTDGNGIRGATVKSPETVADPTDTNGDTSLVIESVGKVELTASKGKSSTTAYRDATAIVSVDPRHVDLELAQYPDAVSVDDQATVRVVDDVGEGVAGVTVSVGTDTETTGRDGFANLSFTGITPGTATITAEKSDTTAETFSDETATVDVAKKHLSLSIEPVTTDPMVEEQAEFRVTDEAGDPVADAFVSGTTGSSSATGPDGTASIAFDQAGPATVFASKDDKTGVTYGSDDCQVTVERQRESLEIATFDSNVEAGDDVTVYVIDSTDSPVKDAEVTGEDATTATTNAGGRATIRFEDHGQKQLSVSKDPDETTRYDGDSASIHVAEPTRSVSMVDVPDDVVAGEEIDLRVVDEVGDPVPGVQVTARGTDETTVKTDADGYARFSVDVPHTQFVEVSARTYGDEFEDFDQTMIRVEA